MAEFIPPAPNFYISHHRCSQSGDESLNKYIGVSLKQKMRAESSRGGE